VPQGEAGGYLAYFSALPGCTGCGATFEAAVRHAAEALARTIERRTALGEQLPAELANVPPVSLAVTVRIALIS